VIPGFIFIGVGSNWAFDSVMLLSEITDMDACWYLLRYLSHQTLAIWSQVLRTAEVSGDIPWFGHP